MIFYIPFFTSVLYHASKNSRPVSQSYVTQKASRRKIWSLPAAPDKVNKGCISYVYSLFR